MMSKVDVIYRLQSLVTDRDTAINLLLDYLFTNGQSDVAQAYLTCIQNVTNYIAPPLTELEM